MFLKVKCESAIPCIVQVIAERKKEKKCYNYFIMKKYKY